MSIEDNKRKLDEAFDKFISENFEAISRMTPREQMAAAFNQAIVVASTMLLDAIKDGK